MKRFIGVIAFAALSIGIIGPASAASGNSAANNGSSGQNTQSMVKEYQQKSAELQKIHQKTLKNDPQLAQEQKQYQQQVRDAMKGQGYDMKAGSQRLQKLAKKLQGGDLKKSQRKDVMQKFQSERQKMVSARKHAMSQPKVKQAGKKLQQDTIAAMKKQNPKTDDLIKSLRSIQNKMRSSMQQSKGSGS